MYELNQMDNINNYGSDDESNEESDEESGEESSSDTEVIIDEDVIDEGVEDANIEDEANRAISNAPVGLPVEQASLSTSQPLVVQPINSVHNSVHNSVPNIRDQFIHPDRAALMQNTPDRVYQPVIITPSDNDPSGMFFDITFPSRSRLADAPPLNQIADNNESVTLPRSNTTAENTSLLADMQDERKDEESKAQRIIDRLQRAREEARREMQTGEAAGSAAGASAGPAQGMSAVGSSPGALGLAAARLVPARPPRFERQNAIGPRRYLVFRNRSIFVDDDLPNVPLPPADDNDHLANGIPCPPKGESHEAKAIIMRCRICHLNQIQTVNFPCMHSCFCLECVRTSLAHDNRCPICRTEYLHISMWFPCTEDATEDDIVPDKKRKLSDSSDEHVDKQARRDEDNNNSAVNSSNQLPTAVCAAAAGSQ